MQTGASVDEGPRVKSRDDASGAPAAQGDEPERGCAGEKGVGGRLRDRGDRRPFRRAEHVVERDGGGTRVPSLVRQRGDEAGERAACVQVVDLNRVVRGALGAEVGVRTEEEIENFEAVNEANEPEYDATEGAVAAAEELGVDLANVTGTGAEGRITKADVEGAAG